MPRRLMEKSTRSPEKNNLRRSNTAATNRGSENLRPITRNGTLIVRQRKRQKEVTNRGKNMPLLLKTITKKASVMISFTLASTLERIRSLLKCCENRSIGCPPTKDNG
jgi:hypothetical protein